MAFQEVSTGLKFFKLVDRTGNLTDEGKNYLNKPLCEGHVVGLLPGEGAFGPQLKIQDNTQGTCVLGGGMLVKSYENGVVTDGDYVQIIFTGTIPVTTGRNKGTAMKGYKILKDPERRLNQDSSATFTVANSNNPLPSSAEIAEELGNIAMQTTYNSSNTVTPTTSISDLLAKHKKA